MEEEKVMIKTSGKTIDNMVWLLVAILLLLFTSLSQYAWGRYVFLGIGVVLYLLYAAANKGIVTVRIDACQKFFILFAFYIALSALWAIDPSDPLERMTTLIILTVCYYPIYIYYRKIGHIDSLISAVKWGGIAMSLYTLAFYGLDNLLAAGQSESLRLGADYANPNTLGMFAAVAVFIQIWQLLFKKCSRWEVLGCVPVVLVLGASQSRKAILYVVIAAFLLVIFKNFGNANFLKKSAKLLFGIVVLLCALLLLSKLEIFSGVTERIESMLNALTGKGEVDSSTQARLALQELGIEWWKKSPIFGIGMANPHILAKEYLGRDYYLHNNYVELLCGGGLLGTIIFYSMHVYCLVNLWKLRKTSKPYFVLLFTWVILMLIMDYGMVSYYSKLETFYLTAVFLGVEWMKKMQREQKRGIKA